MAAKNEHNQDSAHRTTSVRGGHELDEASLKRWDGDCYMGSSAGAIAAVAREHGYVIVDVEPGLDLFLVDAARWGERPVPTLRTAACSHL